MHTETDMLAKHERLIRYVVRKFLTSGVQEEDLLQDARIAFIKSLRTWDPTRGASVWTYAYRMVVTAARRGRRRMLTPAYHSGVDPDALAAAAPDPDDALLLSELLDLLSEPERGAVVGCLGHGLSHAQVARGGSAREVARAKATGLARMRGVL